MNRKEEKETKEKKVRQKKAEKRRLETNNPRNDSNLRKMVPPLIPVKPEESIEFAIESSEKLTLNTLNDEQKVREINEFHARKSSHSDILNTRMLNYSGEANNQHQVYLQNE